MEKQKNTTQNNLEQDKAQKLFNAILEQTHLHTSKSIKEKPKKATNTFNIFTPFKYLWKIYSALAFSFGFIFLTIFTLTIFSSLVFNHRYPVKNTGNTIVSANSPISKSAFLSGGDTTFSMISILAQQKSASSMETIEALNKLVKITPDKTIIGAYGQPLDFSYIGKDTLKFSLKTQEIGGYVNNQDYQVSFDNNKSTILLGGNKAKYEQLLQSIAPKLSEAQQKDFLSTQTFSLNGQTVKVKYQENGPKARDNIRVDISQ